MLAQIRQGKQTVGMWLQSQNFHIARAIAAQGLFDWLMVDLEHSPTDLSTAMMMLATIADVSGGNCTPLARVAHSTMFHIKQALDAGAQGVLVPMISTPEAAAEVVRFARYPPLGERGAGGVTPQYGFGITNAAEYVKNANQEILVAIQIETVQAVENIDAILAVPGIDMIFIGPNDLHISLGLGSTLWSDAPAFQTAFYKVVDACKNHGMPVGTMCPDAAGAKARLADGFAFVSLASDVRVMLAAVNSEYAQVRA
jgi:2-keto-3-deoxy-L-rhamnonate aldolase RhmA